MGGGILPTPRQKLRLATTQAFESLVKLRAQKEAPIRLTGDEAILVGVDVFKGYSRRGSPAPGHLEM